MFSGTYILLVTSFLLLITTSNGTLDSPIQSVYESMTPPMTPWAQDPPLQSVYESMTPPMTADQWHIHDPSRIVEVDGHLMIGVTGKAQENGYRCGLETWYISPGSLDWSPGQCLLMDKPDWIKPELPDNDGAFWAPAMLNSTAMYYSVFAPEDSTCVGMLTSRGAAPNLSWADIGAPVTCTFNAESDDENDPPTSIDPSTLVDADGNHYLVYGGGHIWITGLNPDTGLQIESSWWAPGDSSYERLANGPWNQEDEMDDWVEAAFMYKEGSSVPATPPCFQLWRRSGSVSISMTARGTACPGWRPGSWSGRPKDTSAFGRGSLGTPSILLTTGETKKLTLKNRNNIVGII